MKNGIILEVVADQENVRFPLIVPSEGGSNACLLSSLLFAIVVQ